MSALAMAASSPAQITVAYRIISAILSRTCGIFSMPFASESSRARPTKRSACSAM
jgi:hypothetical protein